MPRREKREKPPPPAGGGWRTGTRPPDLAVWADYCAPFGPLPGRAQPETVRAAPSPRPLPQGEGETTPSPAAAAPAAPLAVGDAPAGVDTASWNRLRTGRLAPERTLDLHGRTAQRAYHALAAFLHRAQADRVRCVEIITGRGEGDERRRDPPRVAALAQPCRAAAAGARRRPSASGEFGGGAAAAAAARDDAVRRPAARAPGRRAASPRRRWRRELGVSAAYLSALEHGRRGAPGSGLVHQVCEIFGLIWDEADELARLARLSRPRVRVNTGGLTPEQTALANRLVAERSGGCRRRPSRRCTRCWIRPRRSRSRACAVPPGAGGNPPQLLRLPENAPGPLPSRRLLSPVHRLQVNLADRSRLIPSAESVGSRSSCSAEAEHPRLRCGTKRRGWSAFADHDGGDTSNSFVEADEVNWCQRPGNRPG